MSKKKRPDAQALCFIGIFVALTAVMAQISVPLPLGVPLTMQTFAVSMTGILLGNRLGFWAVLCYVLLGATGVPVFAGFTGGPHILAGYTGGFLLSFPAMAWVIGFFSQRASKKYAMALGLLAGTALNYTCGILFFSILTGSGLHAAFLACAAPFLPTELIKAVLAGTLGTLIKKRARHILPA